MARRISQETFDDVVKENIEEFEMEKDDAVKEAIAQFRKQGIDLSNIDLTGGEGRQQLLEAIATVQNTSIRTANASKLDTLLSAVQEIGTVCDKSHACSRRNLLIMEEEGGFNALQWHLDSNEHPTVIAKVLKVLMDLSFQQDYTRDLFEPGGSLKLVTLISSLISAAGESDTPNDEKLAVLADALALAKVVSRSENNKSKGLTSFACRPFNDINIFHRFAYEV